MKGTASSITSTVLQAPILWEERGKVKPCLDLPPNVEPELCLRLAPRGHECNLLE